MKRNFIEPLEDRIAPATLVNPFTVTYQNFESNGTIQGDTVVVHISKPLFTSAAAANKILLFSSSPGSGTAKDLYGGNTTPEFLAEIHLQGMAAAAGMDISVKIIPHAGVGNGQLVVGDINAGFFNTQTGQGQGIITLGAVNVQGALEGFSCGGTFSIPDAVQSLTVDSLSGNSTVLGTIGNLHVKGDFTGFLTVTGFRFGSIDRLTIGGSMTADSAGDSGTGTILYAGHIGTATIGNLVGGTATATSSTTNNDTGELISIAGGIHSLHVTGNITGGAGQNSGFVNLSGGGIQKLTVDGNITGGSGAQSGVVSAGNASIGQIRIGGSVTGGAGATSGVIAASLAIQSVSVGGSLMGSTGNTSGVITSGIAIGKVAIGGSVTGGAAGTAADVSTSAAKVAGVSGVIEAPSVGTVTIGNSLVGGTPDASSITGDGTANATADTSGAILANSITSVTIGGSITGNGGPMNGVISGQTGALNTTFGTIKVGGALTGGAGSQSGSILGSGTFGGSIKSVSIGGNVTGGAGTQSGEILANSFLTTLTIGGDLTGGTVSQSGDVLIGGALTTGVIKGNIIGGTANSATQVIDSGYLQAHHIGSLLVGKGITSGSNSNSGGSIANSGSIRSTLDIGSLTIDGAITGTATNPVVISAEKGPETGANLKTDLAIGSVTVNGAVTHLDLLAGYSQDVTNSALGAPVDGAAQIDSIHFLSTLAASNLVAGAKTDSNGQFGTSGVKAITPRAGAAGVLSSIASIIVGGAATGDGTPANSYGIVAESLGAISINGATVPTNGLTPGTPVAVSGSNLFLLEPLLK